MSGFKVGDRVMVLRDRAATADVLQGDLGTVTDVTDGVVHARMDRIRSLDGVWHFSIRPGVDLELVPAVEERLRKQFRWLGQQLKEAADDANLCSLYEEWSPACRWLGCGTPAAGGPVA